MSRYRVRLTGVVEADNLNDLNDLLANLEASAEGDAGMTAVWAVAVPVEVAPIAPPAPEGGEAHA